MQSALNRPGLELRDQTRKKRKNQFPDDCKLKFHMIMNDVCKAILLELTAMQPLSSECFVVASARNAQVGRIGRL